MNLLEFCIFSASNRVDKKTKRLEFSEEVRQGKKLVLRELTVAFSSEYGRPTPSDDLLLTALIKISRDQHFKQPRVYFTRYEILKTLGWAEGAKNYERIEKGFDRLRGVHMNWKNWYWDRKNRVWATRKFGLIDDVELLDRGQYSRIQKEGTSRPKSWFKWSDIMFESFHSNYIKTLYLDDLLAIKGDIARRLYRFLDKRFNNKDRSGPVEIALPVLAERKLGFKKTKQSHLLRMVKPAIDELISRGHLSESSVNYLEKNGTYYFRFRPPKKSTKKLTEKKQLAVNSPELSAEQTDVMKKLVKLGVVGGFEKPTSAGNLAGLNPKRTLKMIEYYIDFNSKPNNLPVKKNLGWLIASIQSENELGFLPDSFESLADRAEKALDRKHREEIKLKKMRIEERQKLKVKLEKKKRVEEFLRNLSFVEKQRLESLAIAEHPSIGERIRQSDCSPEMVATYKKNALNLHIEKILQSSGRGI